MTKQENLDTIYGCLVRLRLDHHHGLRAVGSGNAHEVFTRFGVDGPVAEMAQISLETLEEFGGMSNPMELIDLLADTLNPDGTLKDPFKFNCQGVKPGEKDEHGLFTHPDLLFTAPNHNGRRFGIDADATLSRGGGIPHYQDWRDADEIIRDAPRVLRCWDAKDGRYLTDAEIAAQFSPGN